MDGHGDDLNEIIEAEETYEGGSNQEDLKQSSIKTIDQSVQDIQNIINTPDLASDVKVSIVSKLLKLLGDVDKYAYQSLIHMYEQHPQYLTLDSFHTLFKKIVDQRTIQPEVISMLFKSAVLIFKDINSLSKIFNSHSKNEDVQIEALKQIHMEHKYNDQDTQLNDLIAKFWCLVACTKFNNISIPIQYSGTTAWAAQMVKCICNDHCKPLKKWLEAPLDQTPFMKRGLKDRNHVEDAIKPFAFILNIEIIKDRSPYGLVLTKKSNDQTLDNNLNNQVLKTIESLKNINSYIYPEIISNVPFVTNIFNIMEKRIKRLENKEKVTKKKLTLPNLNTPILSQHNSYNNTKNNNNKKQINK